MAWMMKSMPSDVATPISSIRGGVGANEHGEVIEVEHSNWVSVGVQHVVIGDLVLAGGTHDHRIHTVNLP